MKLSERIDDLRECCELPQAALNVIHECYELARRVEGAAVAKVRGKVGDVCMVPVSHDYCGQRVRLVPEVE